MRVLRTGVAAGAIGALALTGAGLGVATAANGGSLVLGAHNTATSTTALKDSNGTPLSLVGKTSKPPLTVNSSRQVAHLNASMLGGETAGALASRGSGVQTKWLNVLRTVHIFSTSETDATKVASTAKLGAGTYYLVGSVDAVNLDVGVFHATGCFLGTDNNLNDALQFAAGNSQGAVSLNLVAVTTLKKPTKIGEYCYAPDTNPETAALVAIKIAHSSAGTIP